MGNHAEVLIKFLDDHWCVKAGQGLAPETLTDVNLSKLKELRQTYLRQLFQMSIEQLTYATREAIVDQDRDRPFNSFGSDADFEHYGRCAFLTVDEAVAISLGKDPSVVCWGMVHPYLKSGSLFAHEYAKRLDLVERAVAWGELAQRFTPLQFVTWAHTYNVPLPNQFVQSTFARGAPIRYWHEQCLILEQKLAEASAALEAKRAELAALEQSLEQLGQMSFDEWLEAEAKIDHLKEAHNEEVAALQHGLGCANQECASLRAQLEEVQAQSHQDDPLTPAERKSLLTMLIAIAVDALGYNPNELKSPTPREIADAAVRIGLKLSDDTARKYLQEAAQLEGLDCTDASRRKPISGKQKPKPV